jgi:hypothetical protein
MITPQEKAIRMKFFWVADPNSYAKFTCGLSLRHTAIIFTSIMIALQICLLFLSIRIALSISNDFTPELIYQSLLLVLWLVMLVGPLTQNFELCFANTNIIEYSTILEFIIKIVITINAFVILDKTYLYNILIGYVVIAYCILWFVTVYIYYSYAKTLGLKLLLNDANQINDPTSFLIPPNNSDSSQASKDTNLTLERSPMAIILSNASDIAFARGIPNTIVSQITLPSGLVVPSGKDGKQWKVIGEKIILC